MCCISPDWLPFDGIFEVGLTDGAVVEKYSGTRAVLPPNGTWMML